MRVLIVGDEIDLLGHHVLAHFHIVDDHNEGFESRSQLVLEHCVVLYVHPDFLKNSTLDDFAKDFHGEFYQILDVEFSSLLGRLGLAAPDPEFAYFARHTVCICEKDHECSVADLVQYCLTEVVDNQLKICKQFNCILQQKQNDIVLL